MNGFIFGLASLIGFFVGIFSILFWIDITGREIRKLK